MNNAVNGIIEDLEGIVRPTDAQGNPLPMATVNIGMDTAAMVKMGIAALLVGVATGAINRKFFKGK